MWSMLISNPTLQRLFMKLQKLLRTDLHYLLHGGTILTLGGFFAAGSGFILTLALTRIFSQTEYGTYNYILAIAGAVSGFTLTGIDTAITQSVARGHERTLVSGSLIKLRWSMPISLVSAAVGLYYMFQGNATLGLSLFVIAIFTPPLYASMVYVAYFNGKRLFKKISIDNALKNILISGSIIVTAFLTHDVLLTIVAFFVSSTLISVLRYFYLIRTRSILSASDDPKSLTFGKHLSVMDSFSILSTYIDKIIVFQLLGATPLAVYTIALAPVKQLQGITKIVRTLVLPKYSKRSQEELWESIPHKSLPFLIISILIIVLYCFFAEILFVYVFPNYHEAIRYSQVLSLTLLSMPFILQTQALTALGKKRELYILHVTKPFIRVFFLFLLVPTFGIWGAVYAFLCFYLVHYAILLFFFTKAAVKKRD